MAWNPERFCKPRRVRWQPTALVTPGQASVYHPREPHPCTTGDGEQVWVATAGSCAEAGLRAPGGMAPPAPAVPICSHSGGHASVLGCF